MKIISLFYQNGLDELFYNHKRFCEENKFKHELYYIKDNLQKYHLIYFLLEKNPNEALIFIDSNSFFKNFKFEFVFEQNIVFQSLHGNLQDNLIFAKKTSESLSVIKKVIMEAADQIVIKNSLNFTPNISDEYFLPNLYQQNGVYFNINICDHSNYNDANIFVCHIKPCRWDYISYANLICNYRPSEYHYIKSKYDVINPGMKNALATLYTPEIKDVAIISEKSISEYCVKNNITFYVYRDLPAEFGEMNGTFAKPQILTRHIKQHEYIGWIDSDILISKDYEMIFRDELQVYNDPCSCEFNAGFMVFKNTPKNESLLQAVTQRIADLDRKDSVYVNGGDQTHFIDQVKAHYPELLPRSNMLTNSHIDFQLIDSIKKMIHFMGLPTHIRRIMMDVYYQKFQEQT